jgi:outer membrane lipoprotein-sorting protein
MKIFLFFIFIFKTLLFSNDLDLFKKPFLMNFTQSTKYPFLEKKEHKKGYLLFSPPSSYVYKLENDFIVSNGKKTWIYVRGEEGFDTPTVYIKDKTKNDFIKFFIDQKRKVKSVYKKGIKTTLVFKENKKLDFKSAKITYLKKDSIYLESFSFLNDSNVKTVYKTNSFKFLEKKPPLDIFTFLIPKDTRVIK